jgi:hypothetical protein
MADEPSPEVVVVHIRAVRLQEFTSRPVQADAQAPTLRAEPCAGAAVPMLPAPAVAYTGGKVEPCHAPLAFARAQARARAVLREQRALQALARQGPARTYARNRARRPSRLRSVRRVRARAPARPRREPEPEHVAARAS